jgi:hypothetical protein
MLMTMRSIRISGDCWGVFSLQPFRNRGIFELRSMRA